MSETKEKRSSNLPFAVMVESGELVFTDKKGVTHRAFVMDKSLFHHEILRKPEKDESLVTLCSIGRIKIIYNKFTDEYWMLILKPVWVKHRRTMQIESWVKLEDHDFETMMALGFLHHRGFHNPIPKNIFVRNALKRKIRKILGRFRQWRSY